MIQTEYRLVSVGVSVGPAYFPSKTRKSKFQACMSSVKGTPKAHKKESKTLSETDSLFSPEHGLRGIGFGGSPIGYAGLMTCFKVQGNFLLLCSSSNFVGYSQVYRLYRYINNVNMDMYGIIYYTPAHDQLYKSISWNSKSSISVASCLNEATTKPQDLG